MKHIFSTLTCIICFCTLSFAQVEIKVNPVGLLFSNLDASAEIITSESFGIEGRFGGSWRNFDLGGDGFSTTGLRGILLGKYYFGPNYGGDRFYASLYTKYATTSFNSDAGNTEDNFTNQRFAVGFGIGYKFVSKKKVVFDLGFGIGRAFVNQYEDFDLADVDFPLLNLDLIGTLAIGYRFTNN